ncbi:MAG: antibiotic biosynthesis monooxygenase family protein [Acidimicrobiales bacterium]
MTMHAITHMHAGEGKDEALAALLTEGCNRMRAADGCESFVVVRDRGDRRAFALIQRWQSSAAHDTAFEAEIAKTGHIEKVQAAVDQPLDHHWYQVLAGG